ncbi:GCN5-related N-acetyltransferase [Sparassis latifolia]
MASELEAVQIWAISADQTIPLRHSVLWPDHPSSYVRIPEDDLAYHYAAFIPSRDEPVAVISVFKESLPALPVSSSKAAESRETYSNAARFRKFACDPSYQGRGIGTKLLEYVFCTARAELSCGTVWCDARVSTVPWYERRGMTPFGKTFIKSGMEYIRMQRRLPD